MTDELRDRLQRRLAPEARDWLQAAQDEVARDPRALARLFPAVARKVGREQLDGGDRPSGADRAATGPHPGDRRDGADPWGWTVDEAARALLLAAVPQPDRELAELYRHGDSRERRAVLRSLDLLDPGPAGPALVRDALRTNEPPLVAAALGTFGVAALGPDELVQAVLKCVFVGLDPRRIAGIEQRVTPQLSAALAGYVRERVAAGRDVPDAVWPLLEPHRPAGLLDDLAAELDSPVEQRRRAAEGALAQQALAQQALAQDQGGTVPA